MENLKCMIDRLFLIASGLDSLLIDQYAVLLNHTGADCRSLLNVLSTGVADLHHDLEALSAADLLYLASDGLHQSFPVDNEGDSGYDKHEINA